MIFERTQHFKKVSQNCQVKNIPRGKPEQKHAETRNEVSFPSTYKVLNFTNLPLNPTM